MSSPSLRRILLHSSLPRSRMVGHTTGMVPVSTGFSSWIIGWVESKQQCTLRQYKQYCFLRFLTGAVLFQRALTRARDNSGRSFILITWGDMRSTVWSKNSGSLFNLFTFCLFCFIVFTVINGIKTSVWYSYIIHTLNTFELLTLAEQDNYLSYLFIFIHVEWSKPIVSLFGFLQLVPWCVLIKCTWV